MSSKPASELDSQLAELLHARTAVLRRMTSKGYSLTDAVIDGHFAAKRGLAPETARLMRVTAELEALEGAIAVLEARA